MKVKTQLGDGALVPVNIVVNCKECGNNPRGAHDPLLQHISQTRMEEEPSLWHVLAW